MEECDVNKLVLCLTLLLFTGCVTTYEFGQEPENVKAREGLSDMIGEECTLVLPDGTEDEGELVKWTNDTLLFLKGGSLMSVPTEQVSCVKVNGSRVLGTFVGFELGGFIGGGLGLAIGAISGVGGEGYPHNGGFAGCALGMLVGAVIGNRALPNKIVVSFAAPPDAEGFKALPQVVGVLVPALTGETDNFLIFSSEGKTIRLPKERIRFERRKDGIMIWATRATFQHAGLILK
jgi:hypothetical protein